MNEKNMDLCDMKCKLIDALKTQLSGGVGKVLVLYISRFGPH